MSNLKIPKVALELTKTKAVTLGVFDGVHRGHQQILSRLKEIDPDNGLVITFQNHPDEVLFGRSVKWISSHQERLRLLKEAGASHVWELPFTQELLSVTAEDFVQHFFLEQLNKPHVVVGYDLRFGKNAVGDYKFLKDNYDKDLDISFVEAFVFEREIISSTRIRESILMGDLDRVKKMLGRPYCTEGLVVEGHKRGRELGFPTANIRPALATVSLPFGVYGVEVKGLDKPYQAVANLGLRPTFVDDDSPLLEVHLLDFEGDLYGKELVIEWKQFIRSEKRFSSAQELVAQIQKDIQAVGK
jgi:riboflavin kinase/FMN adenylyltransferase